MANIKLKDIDSTEQTYSGISVIRMPNSDSGYTDFTYNGDATATASDVLSGVVAYGASGQITGTIVTKTASDLTASGATVTVPVGYYATAATKDVATGTLGTVSATKGTVSNNSISVTPQVAAGTAGYNAMAAYSGTAVTVSASELVSGSETKTANGTYDVTNLASLVVAIPTYSDLS